jgi:hypothetical protein
MEEKEIERLIKGSISKVALIAMENNNAVQSQWAKMDNLVQQNIFINLVYILTQFVKSA